MIARSNCHMICLCDVSWFDEFNKMAERKKAVKAGGRYCVAGAPNKESCKNTSYTSGISMHTFPTEPSVRSQWVKFVQKHRADFGEPVSKYAALCSAHFEKTCFENDMAWSMGFAKRRDLIVGSIPTRDTVIPEGPEVLSERQKRQVSEHFAYFHVLASLINSM